MSRTMALLPRLAIGASGAAAVVGEALAPYILESLRLGIAKDRLEGVVLKGGFDCHYPRVEQCLELGVEVVESSHLGEVGQGQPVSSLSGESVALVPVVIADVL